MSETVIVAILSLLGTLIGTLGGIFVSNRLVVYRIDRLEENVKETNKIIPRVYELEKHNEVQDKRIEHLEEEQDRMIYDIKSLKSR